MDILRLPGAGGVELACQVSGEVVAPALVLLHALGESASDWDEVLPEFMDRYRVYAFDLRGHKASDWPGAYSSELMRDDVLAALDALGVGEFSLVGHSLGGVVAILVAQQAPDRVLRLVIEDAVPPYPRDPRPVPERPDIKLPFDWAALEAIYSEMSDPQMRWWPGLSDITAPCLVVAGGPESHIPADRIDEMADRIPDCTVVTIPAGHHVHTHAPGEFIRQVVDWLVAMEKAT